MAEPSTSEPIPASAPAPTSLSFGEAFAVFTRIGFLSFGGPAGQIALMHKELVEKRKWIDEGRFLHALNYCMLLPGPEAQQLATYIGWLLHRTRGGLAAGMMFVLPGALGIWALSAIYAAYHAVPLVTALFFGLKSAVLAVVLEAIQRIGKRALKNGLMKAVALVAFVAIALFGVPFPAIVAGAALFGLVGQRFRPDLFPVPTEPKLGGEHATLVDALEARGELAHTAPSGRRAALVLAVCLVLWFGPIALLANAFGPSSVFVTEAVFFSKAAVVTFGGAYSVLAYVAQRAVESFGWLRPGEMLDGLGLAETTPGPLILVLEFVGYLGAYRAPGSLPPAAAGALGALITVWVTFLPSFLWIFLGGPWVEAVRGEKRLHAALSSITSSVVGVVLNLSVFFAIHVLWKELLPHRWGPISLELPQDVLAIDLAALAIAAAATYATFRTKLGMAKTLAASAALGLAWFAVTGRLGS
ncbi:MAG: chromate efflux transporter [Polyangiales bacterium]